MELAAVVTKTIFLSPRQAEQRFKDVEGKPLVTRGNLAQLRHRSKIEGRRHGPPWKKISGRIYYDAAQFDAWVLGEGSP